MGVVKGMRIREFEIGKQEDCILCPFIVELDNETGALFHCSYYAEDFNEIMPKPAFCKAQEVLVKENK